MDAISFSLLPGEVIHNICDLLPTRDLYQLRRTNKRFSRLAAKHVFAQVEGYSTPESLKALLMIARSPSIGHLVHELRYSSFVFVDQEKIPSYRSFPNDQAHQAVFSEWSAFWATGHHFDHLVNLLRELSELKKLQFNCNSIPFYILRRQDAQIFHNMDRDIYREVNANTFGSQFFEILLAIATAKPEALETLILNGPDWADVKESPNPWHLLTPLKGVKHLEVLTPARFFASYKASDGSSMTAVYNSIGVCSEKMVNLQSLSIGVAGPLRKDHNEELPPLHYQAPLLSSLILPTSIYIYLRTLRLQNVKCEKDELTDLLKRHNGTLRALELSDLFLRTTSCIALLKEMRVLSSRLKTVDLRGIIEGRGGSHADWPALFQRQRWNLGCGGLVATSELRAQVSLYLERGGEQYSGSECPFRDDNCEIIDLFDPNH